MEERWDELMLFDPTAYGLQGSIATDRDPQQIYGVRGVVPKAPSKKLLEINTARSLHLGFANEYELRSTENYLKANSKKRDTAYHIPHKWTSILDECSIIGRLYLYEIGRLYIF